MQGQISKISINHYKFPFPLNLYKKKKERWEKESRKTLQTPDIPLSKGSSSSDFEKIVRKNKKKAGNFSRTHVTNLQDPIEFWFQDMICFLSAMAITK